MEGEFIHRYTRKQAIEDGVLIDAGDMATEAGFRHSVALTAAAWAEAVTVHESDAGQDEKGRLWDVLMMLRYAITSGNAGRSELPFMVYVQRAVSPVKVHLKSHCGPGDRGEPVITIMLPHED